MSDDDAPVQEPDFGPGGYLPDRASRRARKIVLRAPMGIQWVIGSLVVGVIVAVAGWFALRDTTPQAPYEPVPAELVGSEDGGVQLWDPVSSDRDAIIVTIGARTRVFGWPGGDLPVVCAESGLLEGMDGTVWRATGRGLADTPSLAELPIIIDDGTVYADPTATLTPLPSDPDEPDRGCS